MKQEKIKASAPVELWKHAPDEHDYAAARDFLSLVLPRAIANATVKRLRKAKSETRKAKDIMRASRLSLLAMDNAHVQSDLAKAKVGEPLAPILLVRGDGRTGAPLLIADGFHRVCASYYLSEDADIPVRLVAIAEERRDRDR